MYPWIVRPSAPSVPWSAESVTGKSEVLRDWNEELQCSMEMESSTPRARVVRDANMALSKADFTNAAISAAVDAGM